MAKLSGRCLCGSVTWKTDCEPLWAGFCHCDSCRRASSAPVTAFFGVVRDSVEWSGELAEHQSSPDLCRGFCPSCGTQLYVRSTRWPTETHLYAATLDDPSQFKPKAHFHYAEKLPWLNIDDDLPKYAASADNAEPMKC